MTAIALENTIIINPKEMSIKTNKILVMQSMLASINIENAVIFLPRMVDKKHRKST
jgi:hypothetical protein